MQSEIWFYNNTDADNFSFRELIAAEHRNDGKPVDDMLLVEELKNSLQKHLTANIWWFCIPPVRIICIRNATRVAMQSSSRNAWG